MKYKFRAWDSETKEIVYPHMVDFNCGWAYYIDDKGDHQRVPVANLMLWTGLCDKNGKEIYEGDVCIFQEKGEPDDTGSISMIKCSWKFDSPQHAISLEYLLGYDCSLEVVGNIHEKEKPL